jgi:hypothetical protein
MASKINEMERAILRMEQVLQSKEDKSRKYKMPFKDKRLLKSSLKKKDSVLILYLSQNYKSWFRLARIVSGDLVVIDNKVHRLSPDKIWRHGKYNLYIIREIDRIPVSNEDYKEIVESQRDTSQDVPLIKAVIGAYQKQAAADKKNIGVIIGIAVVALIVLLIFT